MLLTGCIYGPAVFVGLLLGHVTGSIALGIGAGILGYAPACWVWRTAAREQRELDEYYASIK